MGNEEKNYSSVGYYNDPFYVEREKNGNINLGISLPFSWSDSSEKQNGLYAEKTIWGKDKDTDGFGIYSENERKINIGKDSGLYSSNGKCYERRNGDGNGDCIIC